MDDIKKILDNSFEFIEQFAAIRNQCVVIPDDLARLNLSIMFHWCRTHFGDNGYPHPFYDIKVNRVAPTIMSTEFVWSLLSNDNNSVNFWFKNIEDKILFQLAWC